MTRARALLTALTVAAAMAGTAAAQDFERAEPRTGVRLGVWRFEPVVETALVYDSNIFRTETAARSDLISRTRAEAALRSDWRRHSVALSAEMEKGVFASSAADDYLEASAQLEGVLDVTRDARLRLRAGIAREREMRGGDDAPAELDGPVGLGAFFAEATGQYAPGRLRLQPSLAWRRLDFQDATLLSGATEDQDDRDRASLSASLFAGWRRTRRTELFAEASATLIDFDDPADRSGFDRDGASLRALIGARLDVSAFLEGSAAVGFARRSYDDPALPDFAGPVAEVDLKWLPTRLITLRLGLSRRIEETTVPGASGADVSTAALSADWSIRRFVTLNARLGLESRRFRGAGRTDETITAGIGAEWRATPHATLIFEAAQVLERSDAPGEDHDATRVSLIAAYRF